ETRWQIPTDQTYRQNRNLLHQSCLRRSYVEETKRQAVLHSDSSAKTCVSSARSVSGDPMSKKPNGKAAVASPRADEVVFFRDVEFGPQEGELTDTETKLAERRVVL
ncbi:unnamed protein product, partial [Brassica oleracea]